MSSSTAQRIVLVLAGAAGLAHSLSLADVKHVVMFMQENRSFNHYFGTMAGVRGFSDPNVPINPVTGKPVWYQNVTSLTNASDYLLPFYLNYEGGDWVNRTQCMNPGPNNWIPTQQAMNNGSMDLWAMYSAPQALGYFKQQDIPYHWDLAAAYTLGDHYTASIMSNTDPNRWFWQSGSINVPGGPQPLGSGGVVLDDNQTPGCEGTDLNCVPLEWPAVAEYYDKAGVNWRCYMNEYDYATNNGFNYFSSFMYGSANSSLVQRGTAFSDQNSLDAFYADALNGTLPEISWVFPPGTLQEHPPRTPKDGSWLMNNLVDAVMKGPAYNETVFIIMYDEAGGFADHVWPFHSPEGTAGEWFEDPYGELGYTFSGPGVRVPLIIVSPFTRGGKVFTEHADHASQILFLEEYLTAKGYKNITTSQISDWRRSHMSNLLNAFDFENPDYSIPSLPVPPMPMTNDDGQIIGMDSWCTAEFGSDVVPTIPYGNQDLTDALFFEDGFKGVRGALTEGRHLVFESCGYALSVDPNHPRLTTTLATAAHNTPAQRFVLHINELGGDQFMISNDNSTLWLGDHADFYNSQSDAWWYSIHYLGNEAYTIQQVDGGKYVNVKDDGSISIDHEAVTYKIFSVSYHN